MPRVDRRRQPELNLDSLTDVVTNLAGTLILVVVLVLGVTRPAGPSPDGAAPSERSLEPLLRQIESLRHELAALDHAARGTQGQLADLRDRLRKTRTTIPSDPDSHAKPVPHAARLPAPACPVACIVAFRPLLAAGGALLAARADAPGPPIAPQGTRAEYAVRLAHEGVGEVDAAAREMDRRWADLLHQIDELEKAVNQPPPKPDPAPASAEGVRKVWFRPPKVRGTDKQAIGVVCENGRLSLLDIPALNDRLANLLPTLGTPHAGQRVPFDLNDSDFRFELVTEEVTVNTPAGQTVPALSQHIEVVRKTGHGGQTWEEIARPDSWYHQALNRANRDLTYVAFAVWPDSYEAFLQARAVAWEKGFEVGWVPQEAGRLLRLRPGTGFVL